ncbi:MAG: glycoside hydrolase family 2 TIM barrel-domain containing protein [Pyrinomonadaceae bacterium]
MFGKIILIFAFLLLVTARNDEAKTFDLPQSIFNQSSDASRSQRISYTINDNWRFSLEDLQNAERSELSDENWERINLPHTWNAKDAFDDEPGYRRGASWYRKNLRLGANLKNKRIFLYFEGANQVADVYVNGKYVGNHIGGYTAFSFDVTDFVKFDEPNLLAVKVDNSFNENIPPLTADFNFYGGIYRDAWLIATDDVHLKVTDFASSGVQITTPNVSDASATVNIRGSVENSSANVRKIEIVNSVIDADGKEIISTSSTLEIQPKTEANFEQTAKQINNPKLWSPDNPYLYRIETVVKENGKTLDDISNPLGFRWYKFDAEKGFFLNGKHLNLRGANRHQDYAGMGNAVPDSIHIRDMELIKNAGFNFVRLAHYPQDPSVLQAADRLGILIWEEIPIVNYITISPEFNENSRTMLKEMIRQHRNHPSVILWGYMNEIFLRVPKGADNLYPATVGLARELNKIARAEDATRPTTIAFHGSDIYNQKGLGDITDVVGWNIYSGWYGGNLEDFGKFIDDQHQRFPNRPLIISEYGANGDLRLHSLSPRRFDSTTEYQRMFHESYLAQINARPFISGSALWNAFDFGAELRGETIPHLNQKGLFTYDRKPKDVAFFYKANLSKEPVLHIAASDWKYRAGTDLTAQKIDVYSNLPEVELFCNGASLGKKQPNELHKATWDVSFRDGENSLVAKGAKNNPAITDAAAVFYKLVIAGSNEIAVNVGSNAEFVDESKTVWLADQPYTKGNFGFFGSDSKAIYSEPTDKNILNTSDDPLLQTMRENLTAYRFDVPAGVYEVELKFAETKFEKAGERVFDVKINGETMLEKLDLVKEIGMRQAFTRRFQINAKDGIVIGFTAIKGKPILSGVRIRRI